MPPWRVGGSLTYSISKWTGNVDVWRAEKQDQTAGVETDTPGYTMLNIDLIYKVPTRHVDFSIFLRGTNLLDEDARRSTSFFEKRCPVARPRGYGWNPWRILTCQPSPFVRSILYSSGVMVPPSLFAVPFSCSGNASCIASIRFHCGIGVSQLA